MKYLFFLLSLSFVFLNALDEKFEDVDVEKLCSMNKFLLRKPGNKNLFATVHDSDLEKVKDSARKEIRVQYNELHESRERQEFTNYFPKVDHEDGVATMIIFACTEDPEFNQKTHLRIRSENKIDLVYHVGKQMNSYDDLFITNEKSMDLFFSWHLPIQNTVKSTQMLGLGPKSSAYVVEYHFDDPSLEHLNEYLIQIEVDFNGTGKTDWFVERKKVEFESEDEKELYERRMRRCGSMFKQRVFSPSFNMTDQNIELYCGDGQFLNLTLREGYFPRMKPSHYEKIVFVSDLHLGVSTMCNEQERMEKMIGFHGNNRFSEERFKIVLENLQQIQQTPEIQEAKRVLWVVSGDITEHGSLEEFELAQHLIYALGIDEEDVLFVPGNHDVSTFCGIGSFDQSKYKQFYELFYSEVVRKFHMTHRNHIHLFEDVSTTENGENVHLIVIDTNEKDASSYASQVGCMMNFDNEKCSSLDTTSQAVKNGEFYENSKRDLEEIFEGQIEEDDKVIIVMHHHPISADENTMKGMKMFNELMDDFKEKILFIQYGHRHLFHHNDWKKHDEGYFALNLASLSSSEEKEGYFIFPDDFTNFKEEEKVKEDGKEVYEEL